MSEREKLDQSEIFTLGEDLYGVSVEGLKSRLKILEAESARITRELTKKEEELQAAHKLFGG